MNIREGVSARCAIIVVSLLVVIVVGCSQNDDPDVLITYYGQSWDADSTQMGRYDDFFVYVYDTRSGSTSPSDMDYWSNTRGRHSIGTNLEYAPPRFQSLDLYRYPLQIVGFVDSLRDNVDSTPVFHSGPCNQELGLLSLEVELFPRYLDYYALVIYDEQTDTLLLVDSVAYTPRDWGPRTMLSTVGFDESGENLYYWKRDFLCRYRLADGGVASRNDLDRAWVVRGSDYIVGYFEDSHEYLLIDTTWDIVSSFRSGERYLGKLTTVDERVFVASRLVPFSKSPRHKVFLLVDFDSRKITELGRVKTINEILAARLAK